MRLHKPASHGFRSKPAGGRLACVPWLSSLPLRSVYSSRSSSKYHHLAICRPCKAPRACPKLQGLKASSRRRSTSSTEGPEAVETFPDPRRKLSSYWIPSTQGRQKDLKQSTAPEILERRGFYVSAYAGVFHFLPLGLRILEKLQHLIRRHMKGVGASEVSLSSISSVDLWKRSGRHALVRDELFHLRSRGEQRFLLSPTHEEEITQLIAKLIGSYKDLPLRLFQISRKYRDEIRPRGGLLRGREFVMKDLYTFDISENDASKTYQLVYDAYQQVFRDLKLPVHAVAAGTGAMGGALSHEFQIKSSQGDDEMITCSSCGFGANAEDASMMGIRKAQVHSPTIMPACPEGRLLQSATWDQTILNLENSYSKPYISADGMTLVIAVTSKVNRSRGFNSKEIARFLKLDTSMGDPYGLFIANLQASMAEDLKYFQVVMITDDVVDCKGGWQFLVKHLPNTGSDATPLRTDIFESPRSLLNVLTGDNCNRSQCREAGREGTLRRERSIELAHTFNLGTRYSDILNASVTLATAGAKDGAGKVPAYMGCHGVGLTRIIGAVAELQRDNYGLRWPRLMAPFESLIIRRRGYEQAADEIYDELAGSGHSIDCVIDDRDRGVSERYEEALVVGYPLVIDAGKVWQDDKICNVTYRLPNQPPTKVTVELGKLRSTVRELLEKH